MTLVDRCQQEHHVLEQMTLAWPLANIVDTLNDDIVDDFTCVPVDQDDPLVDDETFVLELDFDGLQHLNTTNDIMQDRFGWLHAACLEHEDQRLCASFDFCAHVEAGDD